MIETRARTTAALSALVLLLGLTGLAGCSGSHKPAALPVASHFSGENCEKLLEGTRPASFTDEKGAALSGVLVGTGKKVGFVLAHMDPGDVCDWLPFARELAIAHPDYLLLCLDFAGYGNSGSATDGDRRDINIAGGAKYLRDQGVSRVLLMGGSMGGNSSVVAATIIQPPVAGVISLSAPANYKGLDAAEAAAKLTVPVLYLAGTGDNGGRFADDARKLYDLTPANLRTLQISATTSHGVYMLSLVDADKSHTREALDAFLDRYATG
jgi:pimeloyl-ACP methyl ester carboxylesterase